MSTRKNQVNFSSLVEGPIKVWKENPPGLEQKELELLFSVNLIDETISPNSVRQKYPLFMKFSPRVFALHFRKTKAKFRNFVKSAENKFADIPELGPECEIGKVSKNCTTSPLDDFKENISDIKFENAPIIAWQRQYSDHDRKCDFVFVAIPIISGSTDINFSLSEDGRQVKISYTWPSCIFQPQDLFQDEISASINSNHQKIHALQTHLLRNGITEKSKPQRQYCSNTSNRSRTRNEYLAEKSCKKSRWHEDCPPRIQGVSAKRNIKRCRHINKF